MHLNKGG
jgi:hypothetical protein